MAMAKQELIWFLEKLVELSSEENKTEAKILTSLFLIDFERDYEYAPKIVKEKEELYLPPCHVAAMPKPMQEEIKEEVTARLKELGIYSPENVERAINSKILDLEELIDAKEYVRRLEKEQQKSSDKKRSGRR